ncbi:hypothetical protein QQX98_005046 [Neonectria punicea]|uniref:Uncharacterized protein n=1 Tax=Neonectria punicea TaxID=979145 RepID=A0ABR1H6Q9_9HYPO
MPYSLKDRRVLVTGGSRGLGALHMPEVCRRRGIPEDNIRIVNETVAKLGGLDITVANAGWTRFSDFSDLGALSLEEWDKCWATNTMAHLQLMQAAGPIFNANPEGGVYLITSSIAGRTQSGSSMAYSVTKAAGLHLMKCIAATQGPKLRINAVLPGQLLTEWGLQFTDEEIAQEQSESILKHETYLDDCADAYISLAKHTSMTGQQITVDAGLTISWESRVQQNGVKAALLGFGVLSPAIGETLFGGSLE